MVGHLLCEPWSLISMGPPVARPSSQRAKTALIICHNAGMVFNATSWGAKLLMQAAYNTKVRLTCELLLCRSGNEL